MIFEIIYVGGEWGVGNKELGFSICTELFQKSNISPISYPLNYLLNPDNSTHKSYALSPRLRGYGVYTTFWFTDLRFIMQIPHFGFAIQNLFLSLVRLWCTHKLELPPRLLIPPTPLKNLSITHIFLYNLETLIL